MIVDIGTALTFDVLAEDGTHLGDGSPRLSTNDEIGIRKYNQGFF
ncbi:hypothetical protein Q8W17_14710 [Photobacterium damselae subsp. piscicida]|nr:hypothetical protein [Photobacterium damselae subsp. piscicida]MDP2531892.1 hypothetical protein [Photobacterium damselae subsp. piscicida]